MSIGESRSFEAKGLTAGSLIFEFSEQTSIYGTQLDGLKFGRIHNNLANCEFKSETDLPNGKTSGSSARPVPPTVEQVATWLSRSQKPSSSSQPFTAFADAFENIGEDATSLQVARASQELWDKTYDWLNSSPFPLGWSLRSFRSTFLDSIPLAFRWVLRAVADHGYRPGKAVYGVLLTLAFFWSIFWLKLNIVAFESEKKPDAASKATQAGQADPNSASVAEAETGLLPVSFLFLFDRLIPAFEIRQENYSIGKVYGRVASLGRFWSKPIGSSSHPVYELRYLRMTHNLIPLSEEEKYRFKKWLIALRIIGVAWGVFLLAALNALIKH